MSSEDEGEGSEDDAGQQAGLSAAGPMIIQWKKKEDGAALEGRRRHGRTSWEEISQHMSKAGMERTAAQVQRRLTYLDKKAVSADKQPKVKAAKPKAYEGRHEWSKEEERALKRLGLKHGSKKQALREEFVAKFRELKSMTAGIINSKRDELKRSAVSQRRRAQESSTPRGTALSSSGTRLGRFPTLHRLSISTHLSQTLINSSYSRSIPHPRIALHTSRHGVRHPCGCTHLALRSFGGLDRPRRVLISQRLCLDALVRVAAPHFYIFLLVRTLSADHILPTSTATVKKFRSVLTPAPPAIMPACSLPLVPQLPPPAPASPPSPPPGPARPQQLSSHNPHLPRPPSSGFCSTPGPGTLSDL